MRNGKWTFSCAETVEDETSLWKGEENREEWSSCALPLLKVKAPRVTRGLNVDTGRCLHLNHNPADRLVKLVQQLRVTAEGEGFEP
jgi:hypothetical protein